jgi:pilus assembly protein CpaF
VLDRVAVASGLKVLVCGAPRPARRGCSIVSARRSRPRNGWKTSPEVFQLQVPLPDVVSIQTRRPNLEGAGEIPLRRLVKEALRMRPS